MGTPAPDRAEIAAEYAVGTPLDLEVCRTEPIHLLGTVQSHGVLLAVDESTWTVRAASRGAGGRLGAAGSAVGATLDALLGPAAVVVRDTAADLRGDSTLIRVEASVDGARYTDVTLHRADDLLVVELEPDHAAVDERNGFAAAHREFRSAMRSLRAATTVTDLASRTVREVRQLTGFDRVVVYRFDGDGPGQVIAEDRAPDHEAWLGWWFPAIDIPPQARRLYLRTWIRAIADVDDEVVPVEPADPARRGRPLDLSGSVLRTVSGYHLEYLRNIGVHASMSVSLIHDGRLWGLIACHSSVPRRLSPDQRAASELFGIALSLQMVAIEERERAAARAEAHVALGRVAANLVDGFPASLLRGTPSVLDLIHAGGAYVRIGSWAGQAGTTPPGAVIDEVLREVPLQSGVVWSTDAMAAEGLVPARRADVLDIAAGWLVLPLSRAGDVVVWLRPERIHEVEWAADPARPAVVGPRGERLTPRGSHTVWRETVRGRARPWSATDREVAEAFGRGISEAVLAQSARLAELNTELARSNEDLDAFAYAASHDFKEPLRGIAQSAAFVLEDVPELDEEAKRRLHTITVLAARMDELLESVLHFSRVGRADMVHQEVDLDLLLDDVVDLVAERAAAAGVEIRRPRPLPRVRGDRTQLREVLTNLVVNAVKYAAGAQQWVEIDAEPASPAVGTGLVVVTVRDNGVGIPIEAQEDVFALFRRLRSRDRASGIGAGLAIARKIVDRHGGRLWVESTPGHGSAFRFSLPAATVPSQ